jgi:hypothetical protein
MTNFKEYYEYYLTLHKNPVNKLLHVVGNLTTVLSIYIGITTFNIWLLVLSPFIIYPFAWTGHVIFEKNEPAAWSRPLWAKACDWVMMKDLLIGKLKLSS